MTPEAVSRPMNNAIVVSGANKRYGDFNALENVDFGCHGTRFLH